MKIYTKTGDNGTTALIGGKRVEKHHPRIEAYGTIDELTAHIGVLYDTIPENFPDREFLMTIQERLMVVGSLLAADGEVTKKLPSLAEDDIILIEKNIDNITNTLPPLHHFVLPGGMLAASFAHVCRTVCRRAERRISELKTLNFPVDSTLDKYINRLSDYFFTLARALTNSKKNNENFWKPLVN